MDDAVLRCHTFLRLLYCLLVEYSIKKRCVTSLFTSIVLVISTGMSAGSHTIARSCASKPYAQCHVRCYEAQSRGHFEQDEY